MTDNEIARELVLTTGRLNALTNQAWRMGLHVDISVEEIGIVGRIDFKPVVWLGIYKSLLETKGGETK